MKRFWHVRPARTVAVLLGALLALAVGCLSLWAGAARLSSGSWPDPVNGWLGRLAEAGWQDPLWVGIGAVLAVFALVFLLAAVLPGGRPTLLLRGDDVGSGREEVLAASGLSALVRAAAERADGVSSASATSSEKSVRVVVRTPVRQTSAIRDDVRRRAESVLERLPLQRVPQVQVQVLRKGEG